MRPKTEGKSSFSRIHHVGVVVKDIDNAISFYESMGMGPFNSHFTVPGVPTEHTVYGKPIDFKVKAAVADLGTTEFELIQPVEQALVQEDFLRKHGEGINHIGFRVQDVDRETAELAKKGFTAVQTRRRSSGIVTAYINTDKVGGVMFELFQPPTGYQDKEKPKVSSTLKKTSPFSKLDHIGAIVKDMNQAMEYYQSLGIGPFGPPPTVGSINKMMFGKPVEPGTFKIEEKMTQMGPMQFQLLQPVLGASLWMEFLETRGEGINHLSFLVGDIEREQRKMEEKGFKALYSSRFPGGGGVVNFDTRKVGGTVIEFVQWSP